MSTERPKCLYCGAPLPGTEEICEKCLAMFKSAIPPSPTAEPGEGILAAEAVLDPPPPDGPRVSKMAIASLVLGIAGVVGCTVVASLPLGITSLVLGIVATLGCTSIASLTLGIISLRRIEGKPRHITGQPIAMAGMVLSAAAILAMVIYGPTILPRAADRGIRAQADRYRFSLREIQLAIERFRIDTGIMPASLEDLVLPAGSVPEGVDPNGAIGSYHGPYLNATRGINGGPIPNNPYATGRAIDAHWIYDPDTGRVNTAVPVPPLANEPREAPSTAQP